MLRVYLELPEPTFFCREPTRKEVLVVEVDSGRKGSRLDHKHSLGGSPTHLADEVPLCGTCRQLAGSIGNLRAPYIRIAHAT